MHRIVRQKYAEVIDRALELMPERIRIMVEGVDILTGVDPLFAGLHRFTSASYGRSYSDTAHVAFKFHQPHLPADQRATTMVLPKVPSIQTVVHEFGHVLDDAINFDRHDAVPLDWYSRTDDYEAFAQSFAAWVFPFGYGYGNMKDKLYDKDKKTVELFERLACY